MRLQFMVTKKSLKSNFFKDIGKGDLMRGHLFLFLLLFFTVCRTFFLYISLLSRAIISKKILVSDNRKKIFEYT